MPAPRKIELLPAELKKWLKEALIAQGFAGYEALAEDLNFRLEEAGSEVRIQKSAIHSFGQEYKEFVKYQEEASAWAKDWMQDMGLEDQAQRHNVLFQMLTTLAFKSMHAQINREGEDIDPKDLQMLGRMMKDVMSSSGIMQAMQTAERKTAVAKLDAAVEAGDIEAEAATRARQILGFV